tara:strand:+ start:34573 stop:35769 length:1197 start_codon:yes stop_codon:yes gene_type:complete
MLQKALPIFLIFIVACSYNGHDNDSSSIKPQPDFKQQNLVITPTILLHTEEWPSIEDDLDFDWMLLALDRQIQKFERMRSSRQIKLGSIVYEFDVFLKSLVKYRSLVMHYKVCQMNRARIFCRAQFAKSLKHYFHMFAPVEKGKIKKALFTAYHTPVIKASLIQSEEYPAGIHLKPIEEDLRTQTRNAINFGGALKGSPYEALYMQDYFDQYLLHVQGGGKVFYQDFNGSIKSKYLNYNGTNSQPFRFISIYMRDKGYIEDPSVRSQREFLEENPDKQEEIYAYSPSYVYFSLSDEPPHGSDAVSLTDKRSIATDYRIYKMKGLLTYVQTQRPIKKAGGGVDWVPMSRFMIDHDTGGAIRGPARGDLYFGESDYAAWVATQMKKRGYKYFLALKPNYL